MVVAHISQADLPRTARTEETVAELGGIDNARVAETRFGVDERVEEPGGVGEVRAHVWVRRAEEVEEDEVLDRREWRRWCCGGDQTAFWVRWEEGRRPYFGEVSVREEAPSGGG